MAVHYAGTLARRARPAVVLEDLFSGALGRTVRIEQFRGEWCMLPTDAQTILPSARRSEGQFARLGVDAVAGERAWEVQGGFRLHIGPLAYHEFVELLPDTKGARFLVDLVRFGAGSEFAFDYRLSLAEGQVPDWQLQPDPLRLGWNTWLGGAPTADETGVVFRPDGHVEAQQGLAA